MRQLTASEIRQIAGRAGRFKPSMPAAPAADAKSATAGMPQPASSPEHESRPSGAHPTHQQQQQQQQQEERAVAIASASGTGSGYVTVLDGRDLLALHAALAEPHAELKQACLMPR